MGMCEPYDRVLARSMAGGTRGADISAVILEPYVCDALGLTVADLDRVTYADLMPHLGYRDGKRLAEWAAANPEQ